MGSLPDDVLEALRIRFNDPNWIPPLDRKPPPSGYVQPDVDWYRAGGDVVCDICQKTYYRHPMRWDIVDGDGNPFLHQICNGDVVKL